MMLEGAVNKASMWGEFSDSSLVRWVNSPAREVAVGTACHRTFGKSIKLKLMVSKASEEMIGYGCN